MDSYIISPVTKTRFIYSLQFEKSLFEVAFQNWGALSVRTIVLSPDMSDNSQFYSCVLGCQAFEQEWG